MRKFYVISILLALFVIFGCKNQVSTGDISQPTTLDSLSISHLWDMPMDGSEMDSVALDSIKRIWENDSADFGLSFPIDDYEMCIRRYNQKPQSDINPDMFYGTWYGYGHFYDDVTILTLNMDGTYKISSRAALKSGKDNKMIYGENINVSSGKFTYKKDKNQITFMDFYKEKDLVRGDYIKYKNPHDRISIIFSLERDTLVLYENTGDCWYYYRKELWP